MILKYAFQKVSKKKRGGGWKTFYEESESAIKRFSKSAYGIGRKMMTEKYMSVEDEKLRCDVATCSSER
jgi:hypothetical protein